MAMMVQEEQESMESVAAGNAASANASRDAVEPTKSGGVVAAAEASPDDAGDDTGELAPAVVVASLPKRRDRPKNSDTLTLSHLVDYNHNCMRAFKVQEMKICDAVQANIPRLLPTKPKGTDPQVADPPLAPIGCLAGEVNALADAVCLDDRVSTKPLRAQAPDLMNSRRAIESLEREAKQWWNTTVGKVETRIGGSNATAISKGFMDRFVAALSEPDSESAPQVAEMLRSLQQSVEQCIQAEVHNSAASAGGTQLRLALRDGNSGELRQLEATVNKAMAKAAATWSDERIRKAAQRQRSATQAEALADPVAKEVANAIRDAIRPVSLRAKAGVGMSPNTSGTSTQISTSSLLERVHKLTKPLEADLHRLAADAASLQQALARCGNAVGRLEASTGSAVQASRFQTAADRLDETRKELLRLCSEAKFEEAFEEALMWDQVPGVELLTEWLCEQVLKDSVSEMPGDFLMAGSGRRLRSDSLKLSLAALLLQRSIADETSLQQAETNLEWVASLLHQFELTQPVCEAFTRAAGPMAVQLGDLAQGRAPPSLAAAPVERRQGLTTTARLAAKQLKMFQRSAQKL